MSVSFQSSNKNKNEDIGMQAARFDVHGESSDRDEVLEVAEIFRKTISLSERVLLSACQSEISQTPMAKKEIMAALFKTKIIFARFLTLYRWKTTNSIKGTECGEDSLNYHIRTTSKCLKNISKIVKKAPKKTEICSAPSVIDSRVSTPVDKTAIYISLIFGKLPNSITNVFRKDNIMTFTFFNSCTVKIRINKSGTLKLVSLSMNSYIENSAELVKKIIALIQKMLNDKETLLVNLHNLFYNYLCLSKEIFFVTSISKFQSVRNEFEIKLVNGEFFIILPQSFAPYNKFVVKCTEKEVYVTSTIPFYDQTTGIYKIVAIPYERADTLVPRLFELATVTLAHVSYKLFREYLEMFTPFLNIELNENSISFSIRDTEIIRISYDYRDGKISLFKLAGIFVSDEEITRCIFHSSSFTRSVFRKCIEQYSLSILFMNNANHCFWETWKINDDVFSARTTAVTLSFCPDYQFCVDSFGKEPSLNLLVDPDEYRKYYQLVSRLDPVQAAVMLQFLRNNKRISFANKTIYFSPDLVSSASFFIADNFTWKLVVEGNESSFKKHVVVGNCFTAKFCESIMRISLMLANYIEMSRQFVRMSETCDVKFGLGSLSVAFTKLRVPMFDISLINYKQSYAIGNNHVFEQSMPVSFDIKVDFARSMNISTYMTELIKSDKVVGKFGQFIETALAQLCIMHDEFEQDVKNRWSLSKLSDVSSFFLIFKRRFTMNVIWKSPQFFQVIIPMVSPSIVLQVALRGFPGFTIQKKLSHPTLKVHYSKLGAMKTKIEDFFSDRDALLKAKFYPAQKGDSSMPIFEPKNLSQWLQLNVSMANGGLDVIVTNSNQTAARIVKAFSLFSSSRELMRCRIIFLSLLSEKPEYIGAAVAKIFEETEKLPNIDWLLLTKNISFDWGSPATITFHVVKCDVGTFSLEVKVTPSNTYVTVKGEMEGAESVTNLSTYAYWISTFIYA